MDPSQYLAALRKRWLLIAVIALVGAAAGFGMAALETPTYRATSGVFVSLERSDSVSELVQGSTYTQNLVQSYAQLATLPVVLDPVIEGLGLDTTARSLATRVTADTPLNTVLIYISAVSTSPEGAAQIADAVAAQLAVAVGDVSPVGADGSATVTVRTVSPAQVPRDAFAPRTKLELATGLAAGLVVGIVLALGRELLNTRVRTTADIARVTDLPVLATVPRTRGPVDQQIVMTSQPLSSRAESYRRVRANLQFFGVSDRVRSVVVTSALPGEGKSTTAVNLALALAEGPSTVLLVDADLRRPSVAEYTGVEGSVGLTTVLIGEAELEDVVQPWGSERLSVLSSGTIPPNPSQMLDSREMASLLERMTQEYDIVVLDSAPLLPVSDSAILARLTDGAVVVAAHGDLHRVQLEGALASLDAVGAACLGIVLNRSSTTTAQPAYGYGPEGVDTATNRRSRRWGLGRRTPTASVRPAPGTSVGTDRAPTETSRPRSDAEWMSPTSPVNSSRNAVLDTLPAGARSMTPNSPAQPSPGAVQGRDRPSPKSSGRQGHPSGRR